MTFQGSLGAFVWARQHFINVELEVADFRYPKGSAIGRFLGVVNAAAVLVCLAPVMLVITAAIWLQDGGAPVLWALSGWLRRKAVPMLEISQYDHRCEQKAQ